LFQILKDKHDSKAADSKDNKSSYEDMKYDFAEDEKLRKVLYTVIHFSDITIEIIGQWIWLSGNTKPHKQELKDLGFRWASKQMVWYYHSEAFRKKSHKVLSMNQKRDRFGSTEVETEGRKRLKQA